MASEFEQAKATLRAQARAQLDEDRRQQIAYRDTQRRAASARTAPDIGDEWWGKFNTTTR